MEPIYSQKFTLSHIHVDMFGRATPAALLYLVQEAAGQHCALLQVDYDTLSHQHLFWAVTRNRVQITRLPRLGETVTVETWPMPTTRVAYPRSVVVYDENHQELFRSISLWVLMDSRTRGMLLPGKSGITVNGTLLGTELDAPRAIATRPMANTAQRTVGYTFLDRNGHMNNTRYLDWVCDLLPSEFHRDHPVREFTVCYMNEAREGEQIDLSFELTDGPVLTVDAQRDGNRIFSAQLEF
jgi:acyl-ACP thioesterase